jgi:hypothetical protein
MLAVLAMGALLVGLPNRFRLLPVGLAWAVTTVGFLPLLAVGLSGGRRRWLGIERRLLWVFVVTVMGLSVANLSQLIRLMLFGGDRLGAIELLASGGALWVTNVVVFAVTYWHADRGGPEARRQSAPAGADLDRAPASQAPGNWPDWHFPQQDFRELAGDWWPSFLDYLFLSYCTATAFSPTGAVPLTARSQLLMLAQSAISLITLALIAARAINILGS